MMLLNYIMHVSNAYADRVFNYSGSEVMLSVFSVRFGRSQLLFCPSFGFYLSHFKFCYSRSEFYYSYFES